MMLGNLRLGWKIGLGFGVVMILMAIASFFGIGSLNKAEKGVETWLFTDCSGMVNMMLQ